VLVCKHWERHCYSPALLRDLCITGIPEPFTEWSLERLASLRAWLLHQQAAWHASSIDFWVELPFEPPPPSQERRLLMECLEQWLPLPAAAWWISRCAALAVS